MAYVALFHPSTFNEDLQNKIDLILTNMLDIFFASNEYEVPPRTTEIQNVYHTNGIMKNTYISIFLRMRIKCRTNISQQDLN